MTQPEIVCIGCPMGCRVTLKVGPDLQVKGMAGNRCHQGKKYVLAEFTNPVRVFTSTVLTEGGRRVLPVKTDRPVHRTKLKEIARFLAELRVKPPVKIGQVIARDVLGTGANLIATRSLSDQRQEEI